MEFRLGAIVQRYPIPRAGAFKIFILPGTWWKTLFVWFNEFAIFTGHLNPDMAVINFNKYSIMLNNIFTTQFHMIILH